MMPRRSQRAPKPVTIWEERDAPPAATDPKITKKTARNRPETALRPIATGPLPEAAHINGSHLPKLPTYYPPLKLIYKCSKSNATGLSKLETFKQLFTQNIIDRIVDATNSYAENARETIDNFSCARPWKPINSTDI
jgi:hypothetical protein